MKLAITALLLSMPLTAAEFKLPENFLKFDPSKLYAGIAKGSPQLKPLVLPALPKAAVCVHARVIPLPADTDPAIALPYRDYPQSKMPILKPPPTCEAESR